jgi:hypothetical protein
LVSDSDRHLFLPHRVHTDTRIHPVSTTRECGGFFLLIKQPELETDLSLPPNAHVMSEYLNCTSRTPYSVMLRQNAAVKCTEFLYSLD